MRELTTILFLLFIGLQLKGQNYAIIEFYGEKSDNTTTYLGKVRKGNANQLVNYLKYARDGEEDKDDVGSYAPQADPNPKPHKKLKQLTDRYDVDEDKLKRRKKSEYKKYQKAKAEYYQKPLKLQKKKVDKTKDFSFNLERDQTKLGRQYKVRGKKLRKGKKAEV